MTSPIKMPFLIARIKLESHGGDYEQRTTNYERRGDFPEFLHAAVVRYRHLIAARGPISSDFYGANVHLRERSGKVEKVSTLDDVSRYYNVL